MHFKITQICIKHQKYNSKVTKNMNTCTRKIFGDIKHFVIVIVQHLSFFATLIRYIYSLCSQSMAFAMNVSISLIEIKQMTSGTHNHFLWCTCDMITFRLFITIKERLRFSGDTKHFVWKLSKWFSGKNFLLTEFTTPITITKREIQ